MSIPYEVQKFLWECLDNLVLKGEALDYLQIFTLTKVETMLTVTHEQEEPIAFRREYNLLDTDITKLERKEIKLYVIDNHDYSIMLLADEY